MKNHFIIYAIIITIAVLSSCTKDGFITSDGAGLVFEMDTLTFDTVFTNLGNATRRFKVYNPHDQAILVNEIYLAGGESSDYELNIDGFSSNSNSDIEIPAGDSIYLFAKVFIDPTNGDALRVDSIIFNTTGGGNQRVILHAYGWNATYIGQVGYETQFQNDITLNNSQPYIIMGYLRFKNACLTVEAGAELFMFGGPSTIPGGRAAIIIDSNACIRINENGDLNNPVELKTHRLEEDYQEITFHHQGIILLSESYDNIIHGAIIRNAIDGIQVVERSVNANPKLSVKNVQIFNTERSGILAFDSHIEAENLIVANSNQFNFVSIFGGDYHFKHCTFANYGSGLVSRSEPILSIRDFYIDFDETIYINSNPSEATFDNCIIYGNRNEETEVLFANNANSSFPFSFNNCLMKVDTFSQSINAASITNQDPLFNDVDIYDFRIDSVGSPAKDTGFPVGVTQDALGRNRSVNTPSLGAFEVGQ